MSIGRVAKLDGSVTAIRNGVAVVLNVGDAVNKSDVIQTGSNSSISLSFADGTALNLSASTRMALNEFVYDASSNTNSGLFSLVQGGFAFVAGQVAKTGGLNIETPVATMGIRGTIGGGSCAELGKCEFYAHPEFNGQASTYTLMTGGTLVNGEYVGGTVVGTVTVGSNAVLTSTGVNQSPQVTFLSATSADPAITALAQQLVQIYPQLFSQPPTQPNSQSGAPGSGGPAPQPQQHDNPDNHEPLAGQPPPINVTVSLPPPPGGQAPVVILTFVPLPSAANQVPTATLQDSFDPRERRQSSEQLFWFAELDRQSWLDRSDR